ncbi:MAG: maleylpyruvate isomerase family mycothiol-dependent enzyme [Rhodococcus sp. (in: high G+C Gram-positive bacteria)]|uniref:maleylpyruvate isomerase family mycothiol-dependent enzyme n=1 Tax=Rhodococcus sp. TaxID=1831 RepID=UPI003BB48F26
MTRRNQDPLWAIVHAERTALADDLSSLTPRQWQQQSLCGQWSVEDVLAHLTAAASIGPLRWFGSVLGARFDFDLHNARRLAEHRGATPAETLARFRQIGTSTTAPLGDVAAWLGEVVVHAQDIRQPLGITTAPPIDTATEVARFYVGKDFAVPSKSTATGLRLEATDGPFASGTGPLVTGPTVALVMAMAGRAAYCDDLTGPGLATLRERLAHP